MPTPPQEQQQQQPPQPSPGPPKKRVRSESQLNQKRLADRLGHKERRKEHKQRIGKIEDDISDIKSTLQALTLHLRALAPAPTASLPPPGLTPAAGRQAVSRENSGSLMTRLSGGPSTLAASASASGLGLFAPAGWPTVSSSSASTSSPQSQGPDFFPPSSSSPSSTANYASMWSSLPAPSESMKILNCRCGLQHPDSFNCMDSCNITTVYQRHTAFPPNPSLGGALPRNPSIPAMMLHTMDENLATFFITGFLRNFSHRSLEQLMGFYLIGYRYMRVSPIVVVMYNSSRYLPGNVLTLPSYSGSCSRPRRRYATCPGGCSPRRCKRHILTTSASTTFPGLRYETTYASVARQTSSP